MCGVGLCGGWRWRGQSPIRIRIPSARYNATDRAPHPREASVGGGLTGCVGFPIAGRKIEEALQSGLDDLDAAAANSYLQLSQSLTAVQIEQADQVLQIEGLRTKLAAKRTLLSTMAYSTSQVACCVARACA